MSESDRTVPGERLAKRLDERMRRRPRLGFAPEFYARHGLDDPWAPPMQLGEEAAPDDGGMVFLSGAPYYEMMRRLARARRRRERREAGSVAQRMGRQSRVSQRRWPGEVPAAVASLARESWSDFVLPQAPQAAVPVVEEVQEAPGRPRRVSPRARVIEGASAWGTAGGTRGESAPVETIGVRPTTAAALATAGSSVPTRVSAASAAAPARAAVGVSRAGPVSVTPSPTAYLRASPVRPVVEAEESQAGSAPVARRRALAHAGARVEVEEAGWVDTIVAAVPAMRRRDIVRIVNATRGLPPAERESIVLREVRALSGGAASVREAAPVGVRARAEGHVVRSLARSPALALASSADTDRAASQTLASRATAPERARAWTPRLPMLTALAPARPDVDQSVAERPNPAARSRSASPFAGASLPVARPAQVAAAAAAPSGQAVRGARAAETSGEAVASVRETPRLPPLTARAVARAMGAEVVAGPRVMQAGVRRAYAAPVFSGAPGGVAERAVAASPVAVALTRAEVAPAASLVPRPVRGRSITGVASSAGWSPESLDVPVAPRVGRAARLLAGGEAVGGEAVAGAASGVPFVGAPGRTVEAGATRRPAGLPAAGSLIAAEPLGSGEAPAATPVVGPSAPRPSAFAPSVQSVQSGPARAGGEPVVIAGQPVVRAAASSPAPSVSVARAVGELSGYGVAAPVRTPSAMHAAARAEQVSGLPRAVGAPVGVSRRSAVAGAPVEVPATSYGVAFARGEALRPATEPLRYVAAPRVVLAENAAIREEAAEVASVPAPTARRPSNFAQPVAPAAGAAALPTTSVAPGSPVRAAAALRGIEAGVGPTRKAESASASAQEARFEARVEARVAAVSAWVAAARRASFVVPSPVGLTGPLSWVQALQGAESAAAERGPRAAQRGTTVRSAMRGESPGSFAFASAAPEVGPAQEAGAPVSQSTRAAARAVSAFAPGVGPAASTGSRGAAPITGRVAQPGRAVAEDAAASPARGVSSLSWAASRADVAQATAYGGALGDAVPESRGETRRSRNVSATPVLAQREQGPVAEDSPEARPTASRTPLARRLHGLSVSGAPAAEDPSWSSRADGTSRVHSVSGLFEALARARDTEEVVRVLFLRADGLRDAPADVRAPVQAVVNEIRQEVARSNGGSRASSLAAPAAESLRSGPPPAAPVEAAPGRRPVRSSAVRETVTRPTAAWRGALSVRSGDERVMRLVRKLSELVHLAEAEHRRADARKQVRMAEDSHEARAEAGHGAPRAGAPAPDEKVDVDALVRAVVHAVTEEMSNRRQRRSEDPDESVWW